MIPIKNKKKSLEATVEEMRKFSFNYIEKYTPSKQQLRTYLIKKYLRAKIPNTNKKNITEWFLKSPETKPTFKIF